MPGKLTSNGIGNLKRLGKSYDGAYGLFIQVYPTGAKCRQQRLTISGTPPHARPWRLPERRPRGRSGGCAQELASPCATVVIHSASVLREFRPLSRPQLP